MQENVSPQPDAERDKDAPAEEKKAADTEKSSGLGQRLLTAFVLLVISFSLILWGVLPFAVLILALGLIGIDEFYDLAERKGIRPSRVLGYSAVAFITVFAIWGDEQYISMILMGVVMISMLAYIGRRGFHVSSFLDVGVTVLGVLYVGWFFSYLILIRKIDGPTFMFCSHALERGVGFIFLLIFSTCLTDTGAFFAGKMFGKRKLAPHISPKKTIEGSIGGMLGAIGGAFLIGSFLRMNITDLIAIGILCGLFAQLGDLWASILKRDVKVKDSGHLFAGHGGVLDRFDSILFTGPILYFYLTHFYR